jgi:ubiquinone/menaquinone biosynthesis C-methylase UbiE
VQTTKNTYQPEAYWNHVAGELSRREDGHFIAGDDEPYYRYKRSKFLKLLNTVDFHNKKVLEVGCGPGGNLKIILEKQPAKLAGVDLSREMIALAKGNLAGKKIDLLHVTDHKFPFADREFDIVFTSTVLQHTTTDSALLTTVSEICRVSGSEVYIFERIEKKIQGNESCLGRTVSFYEQVFAEHGFELTETKFLHIQASYMLAGITRKFLNRRNRKEGEKLSGPSLAVQRILLPFTKFFDGIFKADRDLAMLHFKLTRQ